MPGIKNPRGPGKTAGACFKKAHHETICIIPRIRYQCKGGNEVSSKIQTGLRIPEAQYVRLLAEANRMGISVNALILLLIDVGFSALTLGTEAEYHALLRNLPNTSE